MTAAAVQNRTPHYICPPELLPERPIIPGEDPAVWDAFRDRMLDMLAPGSFIEHELAERVALQMWRFRRANRYEADVATDEFESARTLSIVNTGYLEPDEPVSKALLQMVQEIEAQTATLAQMQAARELLRQLPNLTNNAQLDAYHVATLTALVGVKDPGQIPNPPTAGLVRRALADWSRRSIPEALKWAAGIADEKCKDMAARLAGLDARRQTLLEDMRHVIEARQRDRTLLPRPALERSLRYESHVSRQLTQALKLLKEFKAERLANEEAARKAPPADDGEEKRTCGASAPPSADATSSFRNFAQRAPAAAESEHSFGKNEVSPALVAAIVPPPVGSGFERSSPDVTPDLTAPSRACHGDS